MTVVLTFHNGALWLAKIRNGRLGEVTDDIGQGVDLILGPLRAHFKEGKPRMHGQHHDGADEDEEYICTCER